MKQPPLLLTVGMPVYNEEKYLNETLESLLAQTYKDFILIISDNASTDRTLETCKYYAVRDNRIIYIRHAKNNGSLFNFDYVLKKTNTPFFMWGGGHDKWHPQFIEKLLPIIENEDLVLVYPKSRKIEIDGTMGKIYQDDYTTVGMDKPIDRYLYFLKHIRACTAIYGIWRAEALKNCYFKPVLGFDAIILAQAALQGKFKQQKDILFFLRKVRNKGKEKYESLRQISMITGRQFLKNPSVFLLKCQFIFECIKMLYQKKSSLSIISKPLLSIETIYILTKKLFIIPHILPPLKKILKKILPNKTYLFLKALCSKYLRE